MWFDEQNKKPPRSRPRRKNQRKTREPLLTVHARSPEKRKGKSHRRAAIALLCAVIAGTAWLAHAGTAWLGRTLYDQNPRFELRHVMVNNPGGRLGARHIIEYAKVKEGQNLFELDLEAIRSDLESAPLIRSALVQRKLPSTLEISISERVPVARVGQHWAVDVEGYVLGPGSRLPALPMITGFERPGIRPGSHLRDKLFDSALALLDFCETARLTPYLKIAEISVADPECMELRLASGERVVLPRASMEQSLRDVVDVLRNAQARGQRFSVIDAFSSKNVVAK